MKHFFLSEALVNALGWTLLHTLWQGALLALLVWALQTRQQVAAQRFWTAYAALSIQLLAAVGTFFIVYERPAPAVDVPQARRVAIWNEVGLNAQWPITPSHGWAAQLEQWYPLLVTLWLAGLSFFLLRLLGGLWWLRRLTRQGCKPERPLWNAALERLQASMALPRPVGLLATVLVRTPMTLGFLKPVILIPLAMVNQLDTDEVEAILAHELAHILRRDWLLNLWQAFIEALFYYHPAVWWLAAQARLEREHCCDDLAVQCTGNRLAYAKALVRVQELGAASAPLPALGLSGHSLVFFKRRPLLLDRIRRQLQPPTHKIELMEKLTASAILLALLALLGLRTQTSPLLSTLQAVTPDPLYRFFQATTDTLPPAGQPKRVQKISRDDGRQKVDIEYSDGNITRLAIDGKEVPAAEYDKYRELTEEVLAETPPPVPPAPPAPPALWDVPAPAPPAPGAPGWAPRPPMPPAPPAPGIRKERDGAGNTLIYIDRAGDPVEIIVRGDEVWMNGAPLPPGAMAPFPEGEVHFADPFIHLHAAPEVSLFLDHAAIQDDVRRQLLAEQEALQHHLQWEMKNNGRLLEQQQRALELAQRENYRAQDERQRAQELIRESRQHLSEEHRRALGMERAEQQRAMEAQRSAMEELRAAGGARPYFVFPGRDFTSTLIEQLSAEGLLNNPDRYKVELSSKALKVNGKKQPEDTHRRYLEIYRSMNGKQMGEKDTIIVKKG